MSTRLEIKIWHGHPNVDARESFGKLLLAVGERLDRSEWGDFFVEEDRRRNVTLKSSEPVSTSEIIARLASVRSARHRLNAGVGASVWSIGDHDATTESVRLEVDAWSDGFLNTTQTPVQLEGCARIAIASSLPFLRPPTSDPQAHDPAPKVEENLEILLSLVMGVIQGIGPSRMRMVADVGFALPFNCNLLYYKSCSEVLEDLQLISDVWKQGLPGYDDTPLRHFDDTAHTQHMHEWRSKEWRRTLWSELSARIGLIPRVTERHVQELLASKRFDIYEAPGDTGFCVLEAPFFLNAFVDRFFIALLDRAADS